MPRRDRAPARRLENRHARHLLYDDDDDPDSIRSRWSAWPGSKGRSLSASVTAAQIAQ